MSRAKRATRPAMPMQWAEYLGDTGDLSTLEHGAYLLLMAHYWMNGGLPVDESKLARIAGLSPEQWATSRDSLYALFKLGGWKHKRIEADLGTIARASAAGRRGGLVSGEARRAKAVSKQQVRTTAQRSANDLPTKREALKKESKEERTLDPRGSNGADAPPTAPVYTDSRHELWGEGIPILGQLGLAEKAARPIIGRWLKDAKDDAQTVLGAIQRARDNRVIDPIPWITRAIRGQANGSDRKFGEGGAGSRKGRGFSAYGLELARQAGIDGDAPDLLQPLDGR